MRVGALYLYVVNFIFAFPTATLRVVSFQEKNYFQVSSPSLKGERPPFIEKYDKI